MAEPGAIVTILAALAPQIIEKMGGELKKGKDWILSRLTSTFEAHIASTDKKCRSVNTIFTGENSVELRSLYTNLYISSGDMKIRDEDVFSKLDSLKRIVISGTGGAGKTMMMKYLALSAIDTPSDTIPIFVELRNLPDHIAANFYKTLYGYITPEMDTERYSVFREGMRAGLFTIFFDGLDEVSPDKREQVFRSIRRMTSDFPKVRIIASTRPEIDLRVWEDFQTFSVCGMSLGQAKLLIGKIDFPEQLKAEFLEMLTPAFFDKHESFLEIPLLCSLMLLTFNDYRQVPSRVTVFYDQAFETLYRRHDRSKEGFYKREFECEISSDRFRSIFEIFCYRTLIKGKYSFTDGELRDEIRAASRISEIDIDVDKYSSDLVSAICVIMRDGLRLHFIHRSFQEYFATLFMLKYRGSKTFEVFDRALSGIVVNDVASMDMDIDQQTFEREWVSPWLDKITKALSRVPKENRWRALLRNTFNTVAISGNPPSEIRTYSWSRDQIFNRVLVHLYWIYPEKFFRNVPYYIKGEVKNVDSFCHIKEVATLPKEIRDVCALGYDSSIRSDDIDDEDFVEITLGRSKSEWIKYTTLYDKLVKTVDNLYSLDKDVKSRIRSREELDVLR